MRPYEHPFPVPYLKIDTEGIIHSVSGEAKNYFGMLENITDLVDPESMNKLTLHGFQTAKPVSLELNLLTKKKRLALFDVHISWDSSNYGHFFLLPKDGAIAKLENQLFALQSRLASTNFELLDKKEELEEAMVRLRELSGPYIALSSKIALLPLFGDMTAQKITAITDHVLKAASEEHHDLIIVDFTAVGKISSEGVTHLIDLFKMLSYMNKVTIKIAGVKPHHSKEMSKFQQDWPFEFASSLKAVLGNMIDKR
ncbi:rsbT co-antagonist protein RsbR [Bacillus ectoiniformans]|uniref:STAS domain-containing protein n=1 Tax=Bacillus ectoiniformans TaxID=1494429 RepID=UPI0019565169|nr:STAS domain-containing protein [Bacillus ectoiniformans]MBM7649894.1 rsbT co-antagonist protein RsbR [Bacillus ectoiniformans]